MDFFSLFSEKKLSPQFVLYYLLLVLLICRLLVLFSFSFNYVDQDQVVLWLAADEISDGIFREPCFWGQKYNSTLESFFAAPLVKSGISFEYALPVVTTLMAIFPFVFIAFLAKKRNENLLSVIALAVPVVMTVEYDIITSMPRGWVTGLFVASLGFYSLFFPHSKWGWLTYGFVTVCGLWLNPNCIFISTFIGLILLQGNYKKPWFYVLSVIGALPPLYGWYLVLEFYEMNPGYNLHGSPSLHFSFSLLASQFKVLDNFFRQVSPIHQMFGWIFFFCTPILMIRMYRKGKKLEAIRYFALFICFIIALGIEKVNDSHGALFFNGARFFLAYPLLLVFILSDFLSTYNLNKRSFLPIIAVIAIAGFANKWIRLEQRYPNIDRVGKKHWVSVNEVKSIRNNCKNLQLLSQKYDVSLIVFEDDPDQLLNYGCPCLEKDFPQTIFPWYDRRTWILQDEKKRVHSNIMFVNPQKVRKSFALLEKPDESIFILRNNTSPTLDLLATYDYLIRPY